MMRPTYARDGRTASGLPRLFGLTDPERTPDPVAFAQGLPAGAGLIYRHFGADDRADIAMRLGRLARERGVVFLVSADPELARRAGAHGVHWPEARLSEAARLRARGAPGLFTASAHSLAALRRARRAGIDAALLSPVFLSDSPSAGAPLGVLRAAGMARSAGLPVYALAGVTYSDADRLMRLGFSGWAAVSGAIIAPGG